MSEPKPRCKLCNRVVDNFFIGMCPDEACPSGMYTGDMEYYWKIWSLEQIANWRTSVKQTEQ